MKKLEEDQVKKTKTKYVVYLTLKLNNKNLWVFRSEP